MVNFDNSVNYSALVASLSRFVMFFGLFGFLRVFAGNRKYGNPISVIRYNSPSCFTRLISSKLRRAKQITTTTSEYKTRRRPITSSFPTSHLHPFTTKLLFATTTLHNSYTHHYPSSSPDFSPLLQITFRMPPKAAEKKPTTGGKAPAGKAPAEKKEAGKKNAAPAGDKKKRNKARKETYSSYIYKGIVAPSSLSGHISSFASSSPFYLTFCILRKFANSSNSSPQASSPRYRYLKPCHVYSELLRQR